MTTRNVFWWFGFFYVGISLQNTLPGTDVLVVGLLIALHERRVLQLAWLLPVLILIQEGGGTLNFGAAVLWYAAVIALFFIGHWLFEAENMLFIFLLSAFMGLAHLGVVHLMARLQSAPLDKALLLDESILQALFIVLAWRPMSFTRRLLGPYHEDTN